MMRLTHQQLEAARHSKFGLTLEKVWSKGELMIFGGIHPKYGRFRVVIHSCDEGTLVSCIMQPEGGNSSLDAIRPDLVRDVSLLFC